MEVAYGNKQILMAGYHHVVNRIQPGRVIISVILPGLVDEDK